MKSQWEKIFYIVSILSVIATVVGALSVWGAQTHTNTEDIRQLKNQYSEIMVHLVRIEDRLKERE